MISSTDHANSILENNRFTFIDSLYFSLCNPVTTKILIVVDGPISFSTSGFGLGLVLDTLREPAYDYARFEIDLADRDGAASENTNPGPYDRRYDGFRFDLEKNGTPVIDSYDQIWLFGFAPGNDAGPDSNIESDPRKMSELELIVLSRWMDEKQGGVLAMGDHDYLGATMCWKVPRVRHMRRWTNAQGVPPIGGALDPDTHLRHDTNQPRTAGQMGGTATIPFGNQGDTVPQTIEARRYWLGNGPFRFIENYEPHPILCSRDHGVIDILPDHPHEGWLYEDSEMLAHANATYGWSEAGQSISGDEFPEVDGYRQMPEVIAWARTTPNPPFLLSKGPSPSKRFAVIGVYDGHKANVGRVATDETWHHWFSENLIGMKNDTTTNHYEKLQDYFRNVAVWLAPPSQQSRMLSVSAWNSLFTVQGMQEISRGFDIIQLGASAKDVLGRSVPLCTIRRWTWDFVIPEIYPWWRDRVLGPLCLTCPPFELLEEGALGALVQELLPLRDDMLNNKANAKGFEDAVVKATDKARRRAGPEVLKIIEQEVKRELSQIRLVSKAY